MRARAGGYLVDMVIFASIAMSLAVLSGFVFLATIDWGTKEPSDAKFYMLFACIGFGTPLVWTLLNLALLASRGQTGGQYVAGIRLVREDGADLSMRDAAAWWFCFNPLLFSWPMACVTGFPLAAVIALVLSRATIVVFGVLMTICLASPLIAFVSALRDRRHRALHDRIVGTVIVPAA